MSADAPTPAPMPAFEEDPLSIEGTARRIAREEIALAVLAGPEDLREAMRVIARDAAREAVASLCGLVLSRSDEEHFTRSIDRNTAEDVVADRLAAIFGEALRDFSGQGSLPLAEPGA